MIVRRIAVVVYWTTAIIAHLCAKSKLAWNQHYNPDHPGLWKD